MRDLSDEGLASIRSTMQIRGSMGFTKIHRRPMHRSDRRIGLIELGERFAVGIAAPFGRVETDQLRRLAEVIAAQGIEEIRLSPWRALYAGVPSRQSAQEHS